MRRHQRSFLIEYAHLSLEGWAALLYVLHVLPCGGRVAVVWRPFGGYSGRSSTSPPQPSEMSTQYGGKAKGGQDVLNVTSFSGRIYQIPQTVDEQNPAPLVEPASPCTPIHNIELVACL